MLALEVLVFSGIDSGVGVFGSGVFRNGFRCALSFSEATGGCPNSDFGGGFSGQGRDRVGAYLSRHGNSVKSAGVGSLVFLGGLWCMRVLVFPFLSL